MGCGERCAGCALEKIGAGFTQIEIGSRYHQTGLLLCGESSGEAEARESLPFRPHVQSGSLLADALRAVNISREEVAITNLWRCRPPKDWFEGPWMYGATQQCLREYLIPAIAELRPKAILALGGQSFRALTAPIRGKAGTLDYLRGYVLPGAGAAEGVPVIGTYHPAFIRRGAAHLAPLLQRDLRRAFGVATGRLRNGEHFALDPLAMGLEYQTVPTLAEAWEFVNKLDPSLPLAFDIETPLSTRSDEDERTSFTDRDIKLFQCTQRRGSGIAFPFRDEYVDVVRAVLCRCGTKVGFNNWNFDDPVLAANGIDVGVTEDAMVMFNTFQPDLPANLQAAAGFCGFPFSWKDRADSDLEWYGVADVDATLCVYQTLTAVLEREGLLGAYQRYFRDFHPILRGMARRGIPIDEGRREELRTLIEREDRRVTAEVQRLVPAEVLSTKQKMGLKRAPKCTDGLTEIEVVIEKEEKCQCLKKARAECLVCKGTGVVGVGTVLRRWAQPMEFNPNSSLQVKRFMKFMKHPVPKHAKRQDAATGEASDTTEVRELERLWTKTKHPIYPLLIQKRQLTKVEGTYVEGWKPWPDGCVHTTYTFQTATWQTSSRAPNAQNGLKHGKTPFQKELAAGFNGMQRASSGRILVNFDFKSFHALTTAHDFNIPDYARLARIDIHSFVTCYFLRRPERERLWAMSDEEMAIHFKELKKDETFKFTRDFKAKRCIAEGELVLTDQGLVPIQNITLAMRVWDGVEWVKHEGLIDQGIREVITYQGLTATPDHEVFTLRGSKTLLEAAVNMDRLLQTGDQRTAVRAGGSDEFKADSGKRLCTGENSMYDMQTPKQRRLSLSEIGSWNGVPEVCREETDQKPASAGSRPSLRRDHIAVFESTKSGVSTLRRERNQVSLRLPEWVRTVCSKDVAARFVPWSRNRQDQQRRELRAGESEAGYGRAESSQPPLYCVGADFARKGTTDGMGFAVLFAVDGQVVAAGTFGGTDYRERESSRPPRKGQDLAEVATVVRRARTYDLLNAGPRHRFTVSNVLVHNCILGIQFGMGYRKLYQINRDDFASESEAKAVWEMVYALFPRLRKAQDEVRQKAAEEKCLRNQFGAIRHFHDVVRWDRKAQRWMPGEQAEQAVAFLPASHAFGHVREVLLECEAKGYPERYGFVNQIHDSIVAHCVEDLAGECVRDVLAEMRAPSRVLNYPAMGGAFQVDAEAMVGESMAEMRIVG